MGTTTNNSGSDSLDLDIALTHGDTGATYSIEVWETGVFPCGSDNGAATGVYLTTDSAGQGSATVHVPLPAASLAGTTIGDGAGTECVAVVLDNSFSTSTGDRFVTAGFPLHGTDRSGCWPGD